MNAFFFEPTDENWKKLAEYLGSTRYQLVGSTYIMGQGKDIDMLFKVESLSEASEFLRRKGWDAESEAYELSNQQFMSFRAGNVNVLVTHDDEFFGGFLGAAEVCKYLRLRGYLDIGQRDVRVAIHAIVRDYKSAEEV